MHKISMLSKRISRRDRYFWAIFIFMRAIKLSKHFRPLFDIYFLVVVHKYQQQRPPRECASCGPSHSIPTYSREQTIVPRSVGHQCIFGGVLSFPTVFASLSRSAFIVLIIMELNCTLFTWTNIYLLFFPPQKETVTQKVVKIKNQTTLSVSNSHVFTLYKKFFDEELLKLFC